MSYVHVNFRRAYDNLKHALDVKQAYLDYALSKLAVTREPYEEISTWITNMLEAHRNNKRFGFLNYHFPESTPLDYESNNAYDL